MKTIPEFFRNKVILITGATGFLGKPLVAKILTNLSDVQKMYLLIRSRTESNGKVYSAEERLENEFFTSSVFAKLRASHGEQFDSWIHEKVYAVEGDLADEQLGMSPACYERLQREVQVFINAAALVKFDAPIDEAVQLNTFSAKHAVEFAKGCHDAVLIHVSTAYVCGNRTGKVAEELRPPYETYAAQHREETGEAIPDTLEAEIEEMLRLSEAVRTEAEQPQQRHQFRHEALRQLGNGKRNNAELLNKQIDIVRDKWIEARLVDVGMKRAEARGWNDTYTYTKSLGEQMIAKVRGDLPTAIIRPSIIESSLEEPEPGWLDGFRMADPIIVGFGKGRLPDFPGDPDIILDIIPVDFVVNAILAAAMQTYHHRGIEVYHVATGAMNPLTFGGIVEATYDYFAKYPMLDKGKPIPVPVWKYPSVEKFQRELRHKRRMLNVASWLLNLIPLKRAGQKKRRIAVMQNAIEGLRYYIQIYGPYTRLNFEFETGKTHQLYRSLSAADQRRFNFDTSRIDWNHYLQQVHIPGIKRYVLKLGDESHNQQSAIDNRQKPALEHSEGTIDNPQVEYPTIIDLVARRAESIPNKTALQMKRGGAWVRYSYRQLYDLSRQIAFSLWNRGYRKGERFILCAENQPEWGIAYLAAVQIGIIIIPVDWQTPERELFALARFTEAKAILTTATLYKRLHNAQPSTQSNQGGRTESSDTDRTPAFLNINCFCQPFESGQTMTVRDEGTGSQGSECVSRRVDEWTSERVLAHSPTRLHAYTPTRLSPVTSHQSPIMTTVPDSFPDVEIDSDTIASIIFTAGTTVDAKGAMLSHKSFIANILAVAEALPPCETDEFLSVLPLYHAFEFTCGFLMSIYGGATVTYSNTLKPTAMLETMRETRTTVLIGMPRLFKLLYDTIERYVLQSSVAMDSPLDATVIEKVKAALGGHIRVLVSGGAALPNDVYDRFQQLGMPIYQGYGLTETAPVLSVNPYHRSKRGSVGPAVQGVQLQIINPDSDGIGEIVARSPSLMKGYYQNPGATQKVIRDAWLYTGDLGYLDAEGYLYITGRSKDVIVSGAGKNIYPVEIEELYRHSPDITEMCVVGVNPGSSFGEEVHAVIVPNHKGERDRTTVEGAIRQHLHRCSRDLPTYQHIHKVHFWESELPKTPTFEVSRRRVKELLLQKLSEPPLTPSPPAPPLEGGGRIPPNCGEVSGATAGQSLPRAIGGRECVKGPGGETHPPARPFRDSSTSPTRVLIPPSVDGEGTPENCEGEIIAELSRLARLPVEQIRLDSDLDTELGLDSLMRVELLLLLEAKLQKSIPDDMVPHIQTVRDVIETVKTLRTETLSSPMKESSVPPAPVKLPPETASLSIINLVRFGMRLVCRYYFSIKCYGIEHVPRGKPYIIAANHTSHLDTAAIMTALGDESKRLKVLAARDYFFNTPLKSWFFGKLLKFLPFERKDNLSQFLQDVRVSNEFLLQNKCLLIYPEGTRSVTGELQPFKPGVGLLAYETGVPIVPAYIDGTYRALPKGKNLPRKSQIQVIFGEPITLDSFQTGNANMMSHEIYKAIVDKVQDKIEGLGATVRARDNQTTRET